MLHIEPSLHAQEECEEFSGESRAKNLQNHDSVNDGTQNAAEILTLWNYTMVLSIEERQEISRRNGAKSRGPTTDASKFISSRNSLKHGYYTVVHNLPDEDPLEILRLRAQRFADVAPKSMAEEFLTQQCFLAHLQANRVERARLARLTRQMETATAPWHDQRDDVVGKLWKELQASKDAKEILIELRKTTLGLRALANGWSWLKGLLEERGYWLPGELDLAVLYSGCRLHARMCIEDEDAYRLYLWNFRCEPEPPWDMIQRMLEPAYPPPGLRNVDSAVLLPSPAECLERLKQWADDMLQELNEDSERVWTEVEAPALARRTDPQTIVRDVAEEARLHRASNEYRAMYYKAHNALEAIRKRQAAEAKEARKNADREDSRESDGRGAPAGCAGQSAPAAAAPPATEPPATPSEGRPVAPDCVVEVKAQAEVGPRDEPDSEAENQRVDGTEVPAPGVKAGARNEPGFVTETPAEDDVVASDTDVAAGATQAEPGGTTSAGGAAALTRPSATLSRGARDRAVGSRNGPAPGSGDDWQRPPTVTQHPGSSAACKEPWPYLLDPEIPWEKLSPQERAAIEALDRETTADIRERLQAIRSESPLRE